jgi:hypothetical protein
MADGEQNNTGNSCETGNVRRLAGHRELVLLVGLLDHDGQSTFCIVQNISAAGVQVMPYGTLSVGTNLSLRISDETPVDGTVVWTRDGAAGIQFARPLSPDLLVRVAEKMVTHRRRTAARGTTALEGLVSTGGQTHAVTISDLSVAGARLRTSPSVTFGETATVEVPGLPRLVAQIRWSDGGEHGVTFQTPVPKQLIGDLISAGHSSQA